MAQPKRVFRNRSNNGTATGSLKTAMPSGFSTRRHSAAADATSTVVEDVDADDDVEMRGWIVKRLGNPDIEPCPLAHPVPRGQCPRGLDVAWRHVESSHTIPKMSEQNGIRAVAAPEVEKALCRRGEPFAHHLGDEPVRVPWPAFLAANGRQRADINRTPRDEVIVVLTLP